MRAVFLLALFGAALLRGRDDPPLRVLIAINSQVSHTAQRALARSSWLSSLEESARAAGIAAHSLFLLAEGGPLAPLNSGKLNVSYRVEDGKNDTLVLPVQEGYFTLPQKTAGLLRWFAEARDDDILVEVDDDVFVHPHALWKSLKVSSTSGGAAFYGGYAQDMPTGSNANNASKWFVPSKVRAKIPKGRYVSGQFKVLSRAAVNAAVSAMAAVGMEPQGTGDADKWMPVEDEYLGVLMHHAGVQPTVLQRAVAPQCCDSDDLFIVLDGDTFFVKTSNGHVPWDDSKQTANSLCRYKLAAARHASSKGEGFCLSQEELKLAQCPPNEQYPAAAIESTDTMLSTICLR